MPNSELSTRDPEMHEKQCLALQEHKRKSHHDSEENVALAWNWKASKCEMGLAMSTHHGENVSGLALHTNSLGTKELPWD